MADFGSLLGAAGIGGAIGRVNVTKWHLLVDAGRDSGNSWLA